MRVFVCQDLLNIGLTYLGRLIAANFLVVFCDELRNFVFVLDLVHLFGKDVRDPVQVCAHTDVNGESHDRVQSHPSTQHELSVPPCGQDS